jgi:hypothetical protein
MCVWLEAGMRTGSVGATWFNSVGLAVKRQCGVGSQASTVEATLTESRPFSSRYPTNPPWR